MDNCSRHCNCESSLLNLDSLFLAFINWYRDLQTHTPCEWQERIVKEHKALGPYQGILQIYLTFREDNLV